MHLVGVVALVFVDECLRVAVRPSRPLSLWTQPPRGRGHADFIVLLDDFHRLPPIRSVHSKLVPMLALFRLAAVS